jgi:hypothetical protein
MLHFWSSASRHTPTVIVALAIRLQIRLQIICAAAADKAKWQQCAHLYLFL